MKNIVVLVVLLIVHCSLSVINAQDPCYFKGNAGNLNKLWFGKPETALKCFQSIRFNATTAASTVKSMKVLTDLYSFTDLVQNSGPPYNLKIDLKARLDTISRNINSGVYKSDYAFQKDMVHSFIDLHDAHTTYGFPGGYSQCLFLRPFSMVSALEKNNKQVFILRSAEYSFITDALFKKVFNFDATIYHDQELFNVNGDDPVTYFTKIANTVVGNYKDLQVRFNYLMKRSGWSISGLRGVGLDELDFSDSVLLEDGDTINIPNAVLCPAYTGTADFMKANLPDDDMLMFKASLKNNEENLERELEGLSETKFDPHKDRQKQIDKTFSKFGYDVETLNKLKDDALQSQKLLSKLNTNTINELKKIVSNDQSLQQQNPIDIPLIRGNSTLLEVIAVDKGSETIYMIYKVSDSYFVPILKLTTFAPTDSLSSLRVINLLFSDSKKYGYKNVLIDMSYNGGGIICLSNVLLSMIVPQWKNMNLQGDGDSALGIYDFRKSTTSDVIFRSSMGSYVMSPRSYINLQTKRPYTDGSFYTPGSSYTRGGKTSSYTTKSFFPASCTNVTGVFPGFKPIDYDFDKVVIITDGTCGSACSLFTSQLQFTKEAIVMSHGGLISLPDPMGTSSFAGGNVYEWANYAYIAELLKIPIDGLRPLQTSASARFNFNEYYWSKDASLPREFIKIPANFNLYYWEAIWNDNVATKTGASALANLYESAAQIFKSK